ncbi:MAG TPA: M56 family metallopeptidase, partial [Blastocatellia bacterium]|nr:M56 family metallopeptidase [Blastocatellia bacterium]
LVTGASGFVGQALLPVLAAAARRLPVSTSNSRAFSYITAIPRAMIVAAPANPLAAINQNRLVATAPTPGKLSWGWASVKNLVWPMVFLIWAVGMGIALFRLWRQLTCLRRLRAEARPISLAGLAGLDGSEYEPALLTADVKIGLSADVHSPVLLGVWRPMILLPADIADWTTAEERRVMLRHELAHVERRDHWINLLPTLLDVIFFFHPLVRYACRQLRLEMELACDDRVVSLGAEAETYAESILKVAERGLKHTDARGWTPSGAHQLALFSAKHVLERRIEMILNKDRVRVVARQWKYLILPVAMIAIVTWLLIPAGSAKRGLAKPQADTTEGKLRIVKSLGDNKAYADLIEMALHNPDAELKRLAAIRITELEGDGSADAMVDLYWQTNDLEVQRTVVETLARLSEIEPLTKIALSDPSPELRERALSRVKWLKETSESAEVRAWNVPGLQEQLSKLQDRPSAPPLPPPPPPPPGEEMTVEAGKPLKSLRWHQDKNSVFVLLREAADASIRRDTSFFERVLDEDYQETGPSGETMNKAQAIADVKRMDRAIRKFEFDNLSVSGDEHMAFATFLGTVYFRADDQESTIQYRYTINFINRNGELKIAAIHVSRKQ